MKRRLRKDLADEKMQIYKTGGGKAVPVLKKNPHETKLLEIVGSSLKPLQNTFDSDANYSVIMDVNVDVVEETVVAEASTPSPGRPNDPTDNVIPLEIVVEAPEEHTPQTSRNVATPTTGSRRRMPHKPKATSVDSVFQKRIQVLEEQLEMMKKEHKMEMRIKNLKIMALKEKVKYWKQKNNN